MLFNADKNIKDNLFNIYRQDLIDRKQRKEENILQEKIIDKNYIDQINRVNQEDSVKRNMERMRRIKENMNDYNSFWIRKDEERKNKFAKNNDVNINTYAMDNNNSSNINSYNNHFDISSANNNSNNNYNQNNYNSSNTNQKVDFDSQKDHLNPILNPDYIGIRQIENFEKNKKQKLQKFYKNQLDSQITTKISIYDVNHNANKDNVGYNNQGHYKKNNMPDINLNSKACKKL